MLAGEPGAIAAVVLRPRTLELLLTTVGVTVATSAGALVLGIATAWALVALRIPGAGFWRVVVCLPLAIPSYVAAFAWVAVIPGLRGAPALVGVLILCTVPYVTVPAMAAFARADGSLADAARTLGRGPWRVFVTVTLPQVLPAALAGTLLVALYTLADFGAPALFRVDTLTTGIYSLFRGGLDRTASATLSLVLVGLAVLCVWGQSFARRREAVHRRAVPRVALPGMAARGGVVGALAAVAMLGVVVPLAVLVGRAFGAGRYASEVGELVAAAATTIAIGFSAAIITVVVALPVSVLAARYRSRLVGVIEGASFVGHAVPGIIVALALVALSIRMFPGAYQSMVLLIAAYVVLFLPKSIGSSRAAIARVPRTLEDVSHTLGHGRFATYVRVTGRGAFPGILAGGVLVMTSVMKELPATLMLRPTGLETLATELWSRTSLGAYGAGAPAALLLVLVGAIPAWWMARAVRAAL